MKAKQRNVLLIAYDEHLILSFLYCTRNLKGFNYYLLTHKPNNSVRWSRYIKGVHYYKEYSELETVIPERLREWGIDLLMPVGEKESLEVSRHRATFEKLCKVMPLTDTDHFEIATNKVSLNRFLLEKEIPLMSATLELDAQNFDEKLKAFPFPALLKPALGAFGAGIRRLDSAEQTRALIKAESLQPGAFYLQEYISGTDINCIVVCEDGEVLYSSEQESPPKEPNNFNKNDDLVFAQHPEVVDFLRPMLKALNYQGIGCIDLRRDSNTGKIYLLEINARFWGSMMASKVRANVNFPLIMIKRTLGESIPDFERTEGEQISLSTFIRKTLRLQFPSPFALKYWTYLDDPMARILKYL